MGSDRWDGLWMRVPGPYPSPAFLTEWDMRGLVHGASHFWTFQPGLLKSATTWARLPRVSL